MFIRAKKFGQLATIEQNIKIRKISEQRSSGRQNKKKSRHKYSQKPLGTTKRRLTNFSTFDFNGRNTQKVSANKAVDSMKCKFSQKRNEKNVFIGDR